VKFLEILHERMVFPTVDDTRGYEEPMHKSNARQGLWEMAARMSGDINAILPALWG
jgi:hypothetical protein